MSDSESLEQLRNKVERFEEVIELAIGHVLRGEYGMAIWILQSVWLNEQFKQTPATPDIATNEQDQSLRPNNR